MTTYFEILITRAPFGSCKSISGKYSIFRKCYFPERKMFLCVWLYFKKISEKYFLVFGKCYKEKDKTRKTNTAPRLTLAIDWVRRCGASRAPIQRPRRRSWSLEDRAASQDRDRRRNLAKHRADRDRREGEFTISDRNRRRWCLRTAPTGAWMCERHQLGLCLPLALSLSLSLSLSEIHLKWK